MAKLFYTLEEAAERLRKTPAEVMEMARNGQLQELKDDDKTLFRRSAIDQIAGGDEGSGSFNLDNLEIASEGSSLGLSGSGIDEFGDLSLEDSSAGAAKPEPTGDLGLEDGGLDLSGLDAPIGASGADDSMAMEELQLADDDASAPATPQRPAPGQDVAAGSRAGSMGGSRAGSMGGSRAAPAIGLSDSSAESMMEAPAARSSGGSMAGTKSGESMVFDGAAPLEAVGGGSGLMDISSEESFFGAQMIEETMGGDEEAGVAPEEAGALFGGDAAMPDTAAPAASIGSAPLVFGAQALAEARDPKFSGFTAGAMVAAALALVGMGWSVTEIMLGNYTDIAKMIADNWMYVLGGTAGAVAVFGGIGFGIGKAVG
jgi:hypothetical protein